MFSLMVMHGTTSYHACLSSGLTSVGTQWGQVRSCNFFVLHAFVVLQFLLFFRWFNKFGVLHFFVHLNQYWHNTLNRHYPKSVHLKNWLPLKCLCVCVCFMHPQMISVRLTFRVLIFLFILHLRVTFESDQLCKPLLAVCSTTLIF